MVRLITMLLLVALGFPAAAALPVFALGKLWLGF